MWFLVTKTHEDGYIEDVFGPYANTENAVNRARALSTIEDSLDCVWQVVEVDWQHGIGDVLFVIDEGEIVQRLEGRD